MGRTASNSERWAELAIGSVTGATVEHVDVGAVQGEVDALMRFEDGRVHALEITAAGAQEAFELAATINRINWRWPTVGSWSWTIGVTTMREYRRLHCIYARVVLMCESHTVTEPWMLPAEILRGDADLMWVATEATSSMHGHPGWPGQLTTRVSPAAMGGAVDETLSELPAETDNMITAESVQRRVAKLRRRSDVDGRELFLAVTPSAVSFSVYYELLNPSCLPAEPLASAHDLDRVWLATGTAILVSWSINEGWRSYSLPERLRLNSDASAP